MVTLSKKFFLLLGSLLFLSLLGSQAAWAAYPPEPTYGMAVKDGNPDTGGPGAEWQYRPSAGFPNGYDFWGFMYLGGDATKAKLGSAYLRYDCNAHIMYVLVLQRGFPETGTSPEITLLTSPTGNAWAKIGAGLGGSGPKLYNDKNPGEVLWIQPGYDGNEVHARGYEASFSLAEGSYSNFVIHAEQVNADGSTNTAATTGFKTTADPLVVSCPTTENPSVQIIKKTNGEDANFPPGPSLPQGAPVTWTYEITNTGNVALTNVTVTDNKLTAADIICPSGTNVVATLAIGASVTCEAHGIATNGGGYVNIGTVQGTSPSGWVVQDSDPSHYLDAPDQHPSVSIDKTTNGTDGPVLWGGDAVTWTYFVKNTGDVPLTAVTVTDDKLPASSIDCGGGTNVIANLAVGASVTCTASGLAGTGVYANTGSVSGKPPYGDNVTAEDKSGYTAWASGQITPTDTSCDMFKNHTAQVLSVENYLVTKGLIGSVAPGVFFYYSRIVIPTGGVTAYEVQQQNDQSFPNLLTMQTFLWNTNCEKVFVTASSQNGTVAYDTSGLAPGEYFISVKYKPSSLAGFALSAPYPTAVYSFGTFVSSQLLPTTDATVEFVSKK